MNLVRGELGGRFGWSWAAAGARFGGWSGWCVWMGLVAGAAGQPAVLLDGSGSSGLPEAQEQTLKMQLALARRGFSPGSIDGVAGPNTRETLLAFQRQEGLPPTGQGDELTLGRLGLTVPVYRKLMVTAEDLARLCPLSGTWLGKSRQHRLDYETIVELVAERSQASPVLVRRLNPLQDWSAVVAGTVLVVPNAESPVATEKAAFLRIDLGTCTLEAFGDRTNVLAHFPCSIGRQAAQRPVGRLQVAVIVPDPNYTFDPKVFPESTEGRRLGTKLILPPGPNNPVGVVWIGLNRSGYGIHGTPKPEQIGRAESHGCFRLTNWDVQYLRSLVWVSMPVYIED